MKTMISILGLLLFSVAAQAEERFFDSDDLKIRYTNDGEGDPVILIHGSTVNGNLNWRAPRIQQTLAEDYRVIMPDGRGHGKSGTPADGRYGVECVHDVIRLMDHLEIESAHIVGYSMGGMITIKMMTMFPERVRSGTVGGMGWIDAASDDPQRFSVMTASPERFTKSVQAFGEFATTAEEMKAIEVPVKVIVGTDDAGQMRRVARWKEIVPDLDVVYVEGATHQGCVFRPELRDAIKDFLDAQGRS